MTGKDIQVERGGFIRIHHAIVDKLADECSRLTGRQFRLLMVILRMTYGYNRKEAAISLADFCEMTKMGKGHVSEALKVLVARQVIKRTGGGGRGNVAVYAFNKYFEQWDTPLDETEKVPETVTIKVPESGTFGAEKVPVLDDKGSRKALVKVPPPSHARDLKDSKDNKTKTNRSAAPQALPPATHPAILVFDELHLARPPKRLLPLIEDAGIVDLDLWRKVVHEWCGRDYKPTNVAGMLEWYREPERFQHNGNGQGGARPQARSFAQQSMDNVNRVLGMLEGADDGHSSSTQVTVRNLFGAIGQ